MAQRIERLSRSLSIIIPAYNEEKRLPSTLIEVTKYMAHSQWNPVEILVVDDGSSDETAHIASQYATGQCPVRLLRNPGNRGKGFSVRHGMNQGCGDWLLFSDADLSTPIAEIEKLWAAVEGGQAAVAIGSRALDRSLIGVRQPLFRERAGQTFNWVMQRVLGLRLADTQCGFKLFRQDAARAVFARQRSERFGFDAEALFIAHKLGFAIREVPVRWNDVVGSKVSMASGARSFLDLIHVRLNDLRGNYTV